MSQQLYEQYETYMTELSKSSGLLMDTYPHSLPIITLVLYYAMLVLLPKLLAPKKNSDGQKPSPPGTVLKFVMASWNLFLSIVSAFMVLGIVVPYSTILRERGLLGGLCDTVHDLDAPSSKLFWIHVIIYSKFFELVDTLLLIVKNPVRPVPFLHWYHHMTVLAFSWYAGVYRYTLGYWFGAINCFVHTVMYFYYFLTELGYRPSWAILITIIQIVQMFIGIALNIVWAKEWMSGSDCNCRNPTGMIVAAVIMYGSYLYLFVSFFVKRYFGSGSSKAKSKPE